MCSVWYVGVIQYTMNLIKTYHKGGCMNCLEIFIFSYTIIMEY
jgi:hypothetical protein